MTRVETSISLVQFMDGQNTIEDHVGFAPGDTLADRSCIVGLQTKKIKAFI